MHVGPPPPVPVHDAAPLPLMVDAGQARHVAAEVACSVAEYVFAGHSVGAVELAAHHAPAGHGVQLVDPGEELKLPAGHTVHCEAEVMPPVDDAEPAGHGEQRPPLA